MEKLVKSFLKFCTEVFGKKRKLYIPRKAGNRVSPYGSMQGGSTATIECAMATLKVTHITHPAVALPLRKGKVDLHGWVCSISTGDIWVYDFDSERITSMLEEPRPRLKAAR
jgi:carbonic anhydrase